MSKRGAPRIVAALGLGVFSALAVVLHLVETALDPSTHVFSEYANTGSGSLFVVSLLAWSISLLATALWLLSSGLRFRRTAACLLTLAAAGLTAAVLFKTQAVAGSVPGGTRRTLEGRLHDAGAGFATLSLVGAAVACAIGVKTALAKISIALLGGGIAGNAALLLLDPGVGGARQRFLIIAACLWQAAVLILANRDEATEGWNPGRR